MFHAGNPTPGHPAMSTWYWEKGEAGSVFGIATFCARPYFIVTEKSVKENVAAFPPVEQISTP